jgi:hypothetical protein
MSIVKIARYDLQQNGSVAQSDIHIKRFADEDPWTEAGSWDEKK